MELGLPETPFRLVLNSLDILLLKSSRIFHFVKYFDDMRKNITIYSHLIKSIPNITKEKALSFLYYNKVTTLISYVNFDFFSILIFLLVAFVTICHLDSWVLYFISQQLHPGVSFILWCHMYILCWHPSIQLFNWNETTISFCGAQFLIDFTSLFFIYPFQIARHIDRVHPKQLPTQPSAKTW
jgi:hypothetical protein